ncbi:MAG: adenylate kinase [Erysipelotrichaceae bacterium]|nr:adenylate kinase [Erysipelotrichaceae bacterium]
MNLLIMGAPGAGKGTMSNLILENYDVVHISTGDMLRQSIAEGHELGLKAKEYMEQGKLVPDSLIHDMIVERFSRPDMENGFLFDGYPRTLAQAIDLDEILKSLGMKLDGVINLEIEDEVLVKRITGRRSCSNCGAIYNIYSMPPKVEGVCDECGCELTVRKDDNAESLKIRLEEYHKNAQPILEHYSNAGIVHGVEASDKSIDEVFAAVKTVLEGLK